MPGRDIWFGGSETVRTVRRDAAESISGDDAGTGRAGDFTGLTDIFFRYFPSASTDGAVPESGGRRKSGCHGAA